MKTLLILAALGLFGSAGTAVVYSTLAAPQSTVKDPWNEPSHVKLDNGTIVRIGLGSGPSVP